MHSVSEAEVRAALLDCYDLHLACNIVDLGLVLDVAMDRDGSAPGAGIPGVPHSVRVSVFLTPSQPDEQAEAHLRAQVANRLAGLQGVSAVEVIIEHVPAWTPARISRRGRRTLGLDRHPQLVQIAQR